MIILVVVCRFFLLCMLEKNRQTIGGCLFVRCQSGFTIKPDRNCVETELDKASGAEIGQNLSFLIWDINFSQVSLSEETEYT